MSDANGARLAHGLLTRAGEGIALQGSRCVPCGTYYFPQSPFCNNPECQTPQVEPATLSTTGTIFSYTIQHYPPPPPYNVADPFVPYGIALVELPEGIRVLGMVETDDPQTLKVGATVDLEASKLGVDEHGQDVITWKFRPRA